MLQKRTTRLLILSIVCMVGSVALVVYLSFLLQQKGIDLSVDMQVFVDEQARGQEHAALAGLLDETADDRSELQQLVLKGEDDTVSLLSEIDTLARSFGVALVTEKLEVRKDKEAEYDALDITFSIDGAKASVLALVEALESLPFHSHVASAELRRAGDAGTSVRSTVMLTLTMKQE